MRVVEQVVVAVEMVFGNVQHRRRSRAQAFGVFQLEAGKLQHPHVRLFAFALQFRLQNRRADIARDNGIQPALDAEIADQARYRGFAVAAGNRNHLVAAAVHNVRQQFDVAQHASAVLLERLDIRLPLADAGAERQNIETVVQRIFQTTRVKHQPVKHLTDLRHALRFQLRIIRGNLRAVFTQVGNHGNTRAAESGDEDFFVLKSHFGFILSFFRQPLNKDSISCLIKYTINITTLL